MRLSGLRFLRLVTRCLELFLRAGLPIAQVALELLGSSDPPASGSRVAGILERLNF